MSLLPQTARPRASAVVRAPARAPRMNLRGGARTHRSIPTFGCALSCTTPSTLPCISPGLCSSQGCALPAPLGAGAGKVNGLPPPPCLHHDHLCFTPLVVSERGQPWMAHTTRRARRRARTPQAPPPPRRCRIFGASEREERVWWRCLQSCAPAAGMRHGHSMAAAAAAALAHHGRIRVESLGAACDWAHLRRTPSQRIGLSGTQHNWIHSSLFPNQNPIHYPPGAMTPPPP